MRAAGLDAAHAGDGGGVGNDDAKGALRVAGLQVGHDAGQLVRVAAVQDDVEAAGGQLAGKGQADAVRGAGDHGPGRRAVGRAVGVAVEARGEQVDAYQAEGPADGDDGGDGADGQEEVGQEGHGGGCGWSGG